MAIDREHVLDAIEEALGRPFLRGARYLIYRADCMECMRQLPDGIVDLTVTSPPYNIGKEYEVPRGLDDYLRWCEAWLRDIYRLTRADGALWLNLGYTSVPNKARAVPLPYLLWGRCPFFLIQEVVWNYGAGVAGRRFLSPRNEKFLWYVKNPHDYEFHLDAIRDPDVKYPNQKKNGRLRCNTVGKNPSDVWQIAKVTSGEGRAAAERAPHPAQFPLDLINRIVLGFSAADDVVMDPFLGSGTTAHACILHDRYVVGFEVNADYCAYLAQRLKGAEIVRSSLLFEP